MTIAPNKTIMHACNHDKNASKRRAELRASLRSGSGPAGSGKTTLARYFKEHGKNAVDADISGIGVWLDQDGREVTPPQGIGRETNKWAEEKNLEWHWDEEKLKNFYLLKMKYM